MKRSHVEEHKKVDNDIKLKNEKNENMTMILLWKKRNTDNLEELAKEKREEVDDYFTLEEKKMLTILSS